MKKIAMLAMLSCAMIPCLSIGDPDEDGGAVDPQPAPDQPNESPAPVEGDAAAPSEELESNEDDTLGDVQEQGVEDTNESVADADGDTELPA